MYLSVRQIGLTIITPRQVDEKETGGKKSCIISWLKYDNNYHDRHFQGVPETMSITLQWLLQFSQQFSRHNYTHFWVADGESWGCFTLPAQVTRPVIGGGEIQTQVCLNEQNSLECGSEEWCLWSQIFIEHSLCWRSHLETMRTHWLMVTLWIAWQWEQPWTHKSGSRDHNQRAQVVARRSLMVISKGKQTEI